MASSPYIVCAQTIYNSIRIILSSKKAKTKHLRVLFGDGLHLRQHAGVMMKVRPPRQVTEERGQQRRERQEARGEAKAAKKCRVLVCLSPQVERAAASVQLAGFAAVAGPAGGRQRQHLLQRGAAPMIAGGPQRGGRRRQRRWRAHFCENWRRILPQVRREQERRRLLYRPETRSGTGTAVIR